MSVYFSEKFKRFRKDKDLTQDQIADIFHVSPKCVSRWETGANYPDIEILPHIAIFFRVTVDELLGTEIIIGEKKATEYKNRIVELLSLGKIYEAIDTARKAVKQYPLNYELQTELMNALCLSCGTDVPGYKDNIGKYKDEIIALGERISNYCTNQTICLRAKYQLFKQYISWGMKSEATEIVRTLPSDEWYTYAANVGYVLEGGEWRQNQQTCICRYTYLLCYSIMEYMRKSCADNLQKIEWIKKTIRIFDEIFDGEGDAVFNGHRDFYNIAVAQLYCEAGDVENALIYLEKGTQDAIYHCNNERSDYKSSLLIGRRFEHEHIEWPTPRNICWMLWEDDLMKPEFDIIRNEERFIKCFELLKSNSRELK